MQHVVQTGKLARGLNRKDVVRFFHYADHGPIAMRVAAVVTNFTVADVIADRADAQLVLDIDEGLGQALRVLPWSSQNVKGQPLCRFLADSRQAFELLDQPRKRFGKVWHPALEQSRRQTHST